MFRAPVHTIQGIPRHHRVTLGSPCIGEVSFLQDHHGVPDVRVPEMHPHLRPRRCPATTPFDWSGPSPRLDRKLHPIIPWLVAAPLFLVSLLTQLPSIHVVLGLEVRHQWPLCQLLPALWELDPYFCTYFDSYEIILSIIKKLLVAFLSLSNYPPALSLVEFSLFFVRLGWNLLKARLTVDLRTAPKPCVLL